jgi:hypothetical protein
MASSRIESLQVKAILAQHTAEVVRNASGEHHDRIDDGPDDDAQQDRKADKAEQAEEDSEQTQAQLQDCELSRVDIEAADAEHAEEELQEAGGHGGLIRKGYACNGIAPKWCLGIDCVPRRGIAGVPMRGIDGVGVPLRVAGLGRIPRRRTLRSLRVLVWSVTWRQLLQGGSSDGFPVWFGVTIGLS